MPWVGGFSQVRKFLGKSSSRLGNFILCQGINIDIWKENQIKLKYNIAGISEYFLDKEINLLQMYQS